MINNITLTMYLSISSNLRRQSHGRCFIVHNPQEFEENVLPLFFRQSKITSFQRQLNIYGFQRLTAVGPDQNCYYHELFLRHRLFLCERIGRNAIKGYGVKGKPSPDTEPNFYLMPHVTPNIDSFELNRDIEEIITASINAEVERYELAIGSKYEEAGMHSSRGNFESSDWVAALSMPISVPQNGNSDALVPSTFIPPNVSSPIVQGHTSLRAVASASTCIPPNLNSPIVQGHASLRAVASTPIMSDQYHTHQIHGARNEHRIQDHYTATVDHTMPSFLSRQSIDDVNNMHYLQLENPPHQPQETEGPAQFLSSNTTHGVSLSNQASVHGDSREREVHSTMPINTNLGNSHHSHRDDRANAIAPSLPHDEMVPPSHFNRSAFSGRSEQELLAEMSITSPSLSPISWSYPLNDNDDDDKLGFDPDTIFSSGL